MKKHEPPSQAQGITLLESLKEILERTRSAQRRGIPGEGGERPFRNWLVTDILQEILRWPKERIVVGERFDLLLNDAEGQPVATIETKSPGHKASKQEHEDFEERLSNFGTLRAAYITNGETWERLDLFSQRGTGVIRERTHLYLRTSSAEEAEAFFTPLESERYATTVSRTARHAVNRESSHILERLAADLKQTIDELAFFFQAFFKGIEEGRAGAAVRGVALNLFDHWCAQSLIPPPSRVAARIGESRGQELAGVRELAALAAEYGFSGDEATLFVESIAALSATARRSKDAVVKALLPAYRGHISTLCAQSGHVFAARTLLYRIGEDQGVFARKLSGGELESSLARTGSLVARPGSSALDLILQVTHAMQDFLPTVYKLGEFDWWLVTNEKKAGLREGERAWYRPQEEELERICERHLRILDGYYFGRVDVDVWRNLYQHYLPEEERQRLGGFYTPDELVHLVLDLGEYSAETPGLCKLSFIDPASGSGAFVTAMAARLLKHLELDLPCHAELHRHGLAPWKRAELVLGTVARNLHAVDLHPFAAFLTTVNVLFLVMPLYVQARERNPDFAVDFQIFSSDSLEKHDEETLAPDLFTKLNSRIQLTEDSFRRYRDMLTVRFDRAFGNPPWGGVLKGSLAPVYDTSKKRRFAAEYPAAARGKYDIYGLFMERVSQILKPGGRFGFVTQGSFIDKDWAAGLREILSTRFELKYIVDLNPFGQLFFHAMNIPCITIGDFQAPSGKAECLALLSRPPEDFRSLDHPERRARVLSAVTTAIEKMGARKRKIHHDFLNAARIPIAELRKSASDRWDLSGASAAQLPKGTLTAAELLETRQGVTPGGCLELFLMNREEAGRLGLEQELVRPAVKSKAVARWKVEWDGLVLFYPYRLGDEGAEPAFTVHPRSISDRELGESVRRVGLKDALDFHRPLDRREEEIVRRHGVNAATAKEMLKHRKALGLIAFPNAAAYLVEHYERLEGRIFEKKRFADLGKRWYEYHRPRDPALMLSKSRIVSPTLVKHLRFALDDQGFLSDHACLFIQPTDETHKAWSSFRKQVGEVLGHGIKDGPLLRYCLAFLNSEYAQERLVSGHRPRPGEVYAVSESVLREIPIPPPPDKKTGEVILKLTSELVGASDDKEVERLEKVLAGVVAGVLST